MREIKFRGLSKNKKWIYGSLVKTENIDPAIYFEIGKGKIKTVDWLFVLKETIGQFTGLIDKNGVEIFEGDIFKYTEHKGYLLSSFTAEVVFREGAFSYIKTSGMFDVATPFSEHDELEVDFLSHIEVIGNIHQNPELLKQE